MKNKIIAIIAARGGSKGLPRKNIKLLLGKPLIAWTIEKLLKDDSELAKNRAKYIEKHLYKVDGKATERVVRLIEEMIEKSKKREKNEI